MKLKRRRDHYIIGETHVHFLPSPLHPLIGGGIKKSKRVKFGNAWTKIFDISHLIATLLISNRPKDEMTIYHLLKLLPNKKNYTQLLRGLVMRNTRYLIDSKEFWSWFKKHREKEREALRKLPFAKKMEIVSEMQKMNLLKKAKLKPQILP